MRRYFQFILHHRWIVVVACVVLTVLAGVSLSRIRMSSSLAKLFFESTDTHGRYAERLERYGSEDQLLVAWEDETLVTDEGIERLRRVVQGVAAVEGVARVVSLLDAAPPGANIYLQGLAENPVVRGMFLSEDLRHTAIVVDLDAELVHSLQHAMGVIDAVAGALAAEGIERESLHFGGLVAMLAEIQRQTRLTSTRLTPIVLLMLLVSIWVLFKKLWPVVMTGIVAVLAIIWTLGFAALLDRELNLLLAMSPALIVLISFADVVHLCSAYAQELGQGKPRDQAILDSASEVGVACLFTSITTFVGFLGLSFTGVPAFETLGVVLGFGVGVALLLAMTIVPVMFSFMKPPRPWIEPTEAGGRWAIDAALDGLRHLATQRPWAVIAAFAVLGAVSIYGCTRVSIETDFVARMREDSPLRADAAYLNEHIAGSGAIEVFLTVSEDLPMDMDLIGYVADYERELGELPAVGKVLPSFSSGDGQIMLADQLRRYVDFERREFRLVLITRETGVHALYELGEQARRLGEEMLGTMITVEPSGFFYLAGRWLEDHVITQGRAILIAFLTIAAVMVLLFRSLRIGLVAMIPNVVPLLALGGLLGFVSPVVDSDAVIVVLVAIGIAVDDTIHLLTRWWLEARRGTSPAEALSRAYGFAGRAIVMTSVVLTVGFAPFAVSDYLTVRMLGILMPFTVIMALAADLLLLPALITVGAIRTRSATIRS